MNNSDINDCPKQREFKTPVAWLAGRELLAALKPITSYSFMGDKLDPKDWMFAEAITPPHKNKDSAESYWFDYIADTGDGMKAAYTIAALCMSELWVGEPAKPGPEGVALAKHDAFTQLLPRGEFLFVGGDTAYHIADTASLRERFQTPFNWAFDDLTAAGKKIEQRPIYGIPANHDYYDALDGFNRQFLKPISPENPGLKDDEEQPRLALKGFIRSQTSSYVALKLPFNWRIWGFDSQDGKMDKRQWAFFVSTFHKALLKQDRLFDRDHYETLKPHVPEKLIIATPEPTTVFGKWADSGADIVKTFTNLGLEPSFQQATQGALEANKCRLDISGDIHHYERYWGSSDKETQPVNYASVVAGGGGAFLHPSHTDLDEVKRMTQYPSRKDSHNHVTKEILNPVNIFMGGYLWLVGAIVAMLSYFGVTIPQSTWSLMELIKDNLRPGTSGNGLLSRIQADLNTATITQANQCCSNAFFIDLLLILLFLGFQAYWFVKLKKNETPLLSYRDQANRLLGSLTSKAINAWQFKVGLFSLSFALAGFIPLLFLLSWPRNQIPSFDAAILIGLFSIAAIGLLSLTRRYSDILIARAKRERETFFDRIPLWILGILGVVYFSFGFLRYGIYPTSVMTFDLLTALVWFLCSVGLIGLAVIGGGTLYIGNFKQRLPELARFGAIGGYHAVLQLAVPVCLLLYSSWAAIFMILSVAVAVTLAAGRVFTSDFLVKAYSLADQKKIGTWLFAAWSVLGISLLLAAGWGEAQPVSWSRLLFAPLLGACFSCIWFGWYLAVSLAFNGHNNEAGGGARSEQFRHMIRFKLTEDTLTGYVIGVDKPTDCFAEKPPKITLVDVFTIKTQ